MPKTLPVKTRERILAAYDEGRGTREEVAKRFKVSVGMVKKLLQQRRDTGDIAPRHHLAGRKPKILASHENKMRTILSKHPNRTLEQLRSALKLDCTIQAIHYALVRMGLKSKSRPKKKSRAQRKK